jgi:hypothetical protein
MTLYIQQPKMAEIIKLLLLSMWLSKLGPSHNRDSVQGQVTPWLGSLKASRKDRRQQPCLSATSKIRSLRMMHHRPWTAISLPHSSCSLKKSRRAPIDVALLDIPLQVLSTSHLSSKPQPLALPTSMETASLRCMITKS